MRRLRACLFAFALGTVGFGASLACAPLAPEPPIAEAPAAAEATREVRVEPGDTLTVIAQRHGVRLRRLARYNEIEDPDRISVGTTIRIPPPGWQPAKEPETPAVSSAPPPAAGIDPGIGRAADQLRRADLALGAGDHRAALTLAQTAGDALTGQERDPAARDLLARAAFLSGAAHLGLGEAGEASCAFLHARALEPSFVPADGSPAAAVQAFDRSRDHPPEAPCPPR